MALRNVATYLRVSTADQTTANQTPYLIDFAKRREWEIVEQYIDEDETGSKESRPALDRLRADAAAGKFTAILCYKFDRLCRNTRHLLTLHEELSKLGVSLISVTEAIDTSTPAGTFVMTVMGGVAQLERATLIERTKAGIRRARAEGKQIGRPTQFSLDEHGVASLLSAGKNANQIYRQLGGSRSAVYRKVAELKAAPPPPAFVATDDDLPAIFFQETR